MNNLDFLSEDGAQNFDGETTLTQLGEMISLLRQYEDEIKEHEDILKELNERRRALSQEEIPNLLLSNNLSTIKTADGISVTIEEKLSCSLPKRDTNKQKTCLKWIIEMGGGHIIKHIAKIEDVDEETLKMLNDKGIDVEASYDIHSASLKSFISELLGIKKNTIQKIEAEDVPPELNLFLYKETLVK